MTTIEVEGNIEYSDEDPLEETIEEKKPVKKLVKVHVDVPYDPEFKKTPSKLTKKEREMIISNIYAGKTYKHFEIEDNDGNIKVVKKKEPTLRTTALKNTKTTPKVDANKIYMTNDQLWMEHIVKLNKKVAKLNAFHKLHYSRRNNNYDDNEYVEELIDEPYEDEEPEVKPTPRTETKREPKAEPTQTPAPTSRRAKPPSYRDGIKYLP
jgi:hypothetical protein